MLQAIRNFLNKSRSSAMFASGFRLEGRPDEATLNRMIARDMAIMACALCFTGVKQYGPNPKLIRLTRETAKQLIATKAFTES